MGCPRSPTGPEPPAPRPRPRIRPAQGSQKMPVSPDTACRRGTDSFRARQASRFAANCSARTVDWPRCRRLVSKGLVDSGRSAVTREAAGVGRRREGRRIELDELGLRLLALPLVSRIRRSSLAADGGNIFSRTLVMLTSRPHSPPLDGQRDPPDVEGHAVEHRPVVVAIAAARGRGAAPSSPCHVYFSTPRAAAQCRRGRSCSARRRAAPGLDHVDTPTGAHHVPGRERLGDIHGCRPGHLVADHRGEGYSLLLPAATRRRRMIADVLCDGNAAIGLSGAWWTAVSR